MEDEIFIQIRFSASTEYGEFNDALYYSVDEWNSMSQEDIDAEKQRRIDNWIVDIKLSQSIE